MATDFPHLFFGFICPTGWRHLQYGIVFFLCIDEIATPIILPHVHRYLFSPVATNLSLHVCAQNIFERELENRSCTQYSDPESNNELHNAFLACWRLTSALAKLRV